MIYGELFLALYEADYERVERDDRLLDVFSRETKEKGVELWERWDAEVVRILRVRLPFSATDLKLFEIPLKEIEELLEENRRADLATYSVVAEGEAILPQL